MSLTVMKLHSLALLALAAASPMVSAGGAAAKTEIFDWTMTGGSPTLGYAYLQGGGTLTASSNLDGSWSVIAVTGEVGDDPISGVTSYYISNNLVYPFSAGIQTSTSGFAFETVSGAEADIFSFYGQGSTDVDPMGNNYGEMSTLGFGVGKFAMTEAVPEPSTWAMMGLGFAGLALAGWRRAKASAQA